MTQDACRLHLNGRHLSDGLHVKSVVGKLVTNLSVIGNYDDLDDDLVNHMLIKIVTKAHSHGFSHRVSSVRQDDDSVDLIHQQPGSLLAAIYPRCTMIEPTKMESRNQKNH